MASGAAGLLERALETAAEPLDDTMSERILDAALELAAASGFRHLTMDEVAARAGVGRMTVYRRFGSRAQLVDALAVRECRRCLAAISGALEPEAPIEDRVVALFSTTLTVIREHPLLERLARVEPEALVRELTRDDSAVFKLVRQFLVEQIRLAQASGELAAGDPEPLAELVVRLGFSFVLMPDSALTNDERRARETVRMVLAPIVAASPRIGTSG
jgi:AcrR family transcriptional regulator